MKQDDVIAFARQVEQLDVRGCGDLVQSLMLARTLSKIIHALDKLARDKSHGSLAQGALKKLGFEVQ